MFDFLVFVSMIAAAWFWNTTRGEQLTAVGARAALSSTLWFCTIFLLLGGFFILLFLEFYTVLFAGHDHAAILSLASVTRAARSVVLLDSVESGVARDFVAAVLAADGGLLFNGFSGDHVGTAGGGIIPFFVMDLSVSFLIACACTVCIFFMLLLVKPGIFTLFAYLYLGLLVVLSLVFITCHSLFTMFITFECLLLTSLGLLKLTSKSERIGEAISEMFMWTLFGSFFLLLGFFSAYTEAGDSLWHINSARGFLTSTLSNFTCVLFLIGFGVKIPTWPFISWLLKAHVEASVEFSILLSGFIVKLGILGLWRILDALGSDWVYLLVIGLSCLAILDATLRLFTQNDLKRIVALTTVIEMNWLNLCYLIGDLNLVFLAHFLIVAHCFTTSSEFLLVEFISKRYATRDFWQITGIWYNAPCLWYMSFIVVLTTTGFPGTSIFFAKFLFLPVILNYSIWLFVYFLVVFFLVLPLFFMRLWVPIWFGLPQTPGTTTALIPDLTGKEIFLLSFTSGMGIVLGLIPTLFFSVF